MKTLRPSETHHTTDDNIVSLSQKRLLHALKVLPANSIYSLAPKHYVLWGFNDYKNKRLRRFRWENGFNKLTATVYDGVNCSVDITLSGDALSFSCDCDDWFADATCQHVICTIITIKNLFQPESFRHPSQDTKYRKALHRSLFSKPAVPRSGTPSEFAIVLEPTPGGLDLHVLRNNRPVHPYAAGVPEEIKSLISMPPYGSLYFFREYLAAYGDKYPLILKSDNGEMRLQFNKSTPYSCKTEIDAKGRSVTVTRLCSGNDGREIRNYIIAEDIIIERDTGKTGFLKDRSGWGLWHELFSFSRDWAPDYTGEPEPMSFTMTADKFRHIQIVFPSPASGKKVPDNILLRKDGRECRPVKASPAYRLAVFPAEYEKDMFEIRAECDLDGLIQSTSFNLFSFFISIEHEASSYLRANKRREFLYRAFLDMLRARTVAGGRKAVNAVLSEGDFKRASIKREARQFLYHYLDVFLRNEKQLQLHRGEWKISPVDKKKEAVLYRIPYEVFGWRIFRDAEDHNVMYVPSGDLHEKLPLLHERLKEHGVELFFRNKPVVESKWDFAFDATRRKGIDWFEIRPEIRCNGELIDDSQWMEMLDNRRVVEKDGTVRILDARSQKIFDMISTIYKTGKPPEKTARGKKEIVQVPRLQILDWIELRKSGVRVKLPPEDEEIIERLSRFEKISSRPLPSRLRARLRPYQKEGYYWLSFLYEHRFGACLADDMGLGKTVQAITLLGGIMEGRVKSHAADGPLPHLIVVPPTLLFNWESEIKRFYPRLKIYLYTGSERDTAFEGYDIVLTTYGLVSRDIEGLRQIRFDVIIFDEAQAIKNIYAGRTGAARLLSGNFKLAMTGTPLENHIGEYYSIIDLVLPGLLGEYRDFKPLIKQSASPALDMIIRRTRPFVLRRTKEKILKELPPKIENDIYLDLTEKQKALYRKTVEAVRATIDDAYRNKTAAQAKIIALTAILKLRQLCVSPRLISDDIKEPSPKIDFLIGKLRELRNENHSVLVFSQFTSFLDILGQDLTRHGMDFLRLDGSTAVKKRKKFIEKFQSGDGPCIFLLSLKAGGQGLNLTRASYVFHLDPWWNPAVENQASDRAHRIGQKNKVTITRILTHHTIEEKMMQLKNKKLALYKAVMNDTGGSKRSLSISKSDFNFLLS
ncbi:MAG: DEAD/DEAH box helicase [Deferribacteres bacterium]|nr:DEAD/DEAH box helicase [Deferribacteres bacterium]